jgi:hypothetical protein
MKLGFARVAITPSLPISLSGFVTRCDQETSEVLSELFVRCAYMKDGDTEFILLVYDLLGIGKELHNQLQSDLDRFSVPRHNRVLTCTHSHAAPVTVELFGCGKPVASYWERVRTASIEACGAAIASAVDVTLRSAVCTAADLTYNRTSLPSRQILTEAELRGKPLRGSSPTHLSLLIFDDRRSRPVAGFVHWAAHPVLDDQNAVSADYPGELCERLERQFGAPFVFLQGASGNINPVKPSRGTRESVEYAKTLLAATADTEWSTRAQVRMKARSASTQLRYAPCGKTAAHEVGESCRKSRSSGIVDEALVAEIEAIFNHDLPEALSSDIVEHTINAFISWSNAVTGRRDGGDQESESIVVTVLCLGNLVFCFVPLEVYYFVQERLSLMYPSQKVLIVANASPLIGYLPVVDDAHTRGYETEYAHRFYGYPQALDSAGNEELIREIGILVDSVTR